MPDRTEEKKKWCPFLDKYCIGEKCALRIPIQQERMGVRTQANICVFQALVMIMSSRPPQQPPMQKLNLPDLRG